MTSLLPVATPLAAEDVKGPVMPALTERPRRRPPASRDPRRSRDRECEQEETPNDQSRKRGLTDGGDRLTAELFVRSLAPTGARSPQTAVLERLDHLEATGRLATYTVTIWGQGICPKGAGAQTAIGQRILKTIEEFDQWAQQRSLTFPAGFTEREGGSLVAGDPQTVISLPTLCLAVREGGTLRCVAPCANGDGAWTHHSIADCLAELAGAEVDVSAHDWATA